jgi:hypothetical protein
MESGDCAGMGVAAFTGKLAKPAVPVSLLAARAARLSTGPPALSAMRSWLVA